MKWLGPLRALSDDYALREYGITEKQAERAFQTVKTEVRKARQAGRTRPFAGKL
jgi:hypothetical protein